MLVTALVVIILQYKMYQINTLQPETYTVLCQLYLNKAEEKAFKKLT